MPITFQIDTARCLVVTKATGIVGAHDLLQLIEEKDAADAATFALLFDARDVQLDLSTEELGRIAAEGTRST